MADMSDELDPYPKKKTHSRVWTYFSFKKVYVEPSTKENLWNTTFYSKTYSVN